MHTGPLIKLAHIERSYPLGKQQFFYVLRDINLEVEEGDFVSVMAPSGAGKSTLLHLIGMHDFGWTGEYYLDETAVHRLKPKERTILRNEQIGFVFQNYNLLDDLTVYENLDIPLSYRRYGKSERSALVADTLDRFSSSEKRPVSAPALRGPATTRQHRTRDHCQAEADPRRRTDRQPPFQPGRGDHAALQEAQWRRHDDHPGHALGNQRRLREPDHPAAGWIHRRGQRRKNLMILESFGQDVRVGLRLLLKDRVFLSPSIVSGELPFSCQLRDHLA